MQKSDHIDLIDVIDVVVEIDLQLVQTTVCNIVAVESVKDESIDSHCLAHFAILYATVFAREKSRCSCCCRRITHQDALILGSCGAALI